MKSITLAMLAAMASGVALATGADLADAEMRAQALADEIVKACGQLREQPRWSCVDKRIEGLPSDYGGRAKYLAYEAMNIADDDRLNALCSRAKMPRGTVRIGMTKQQVRDCGWGRPAQVNSTTTRFGTREQWVYGSGNYLYFDRGGLLEAIQN